MPSWMLLMLLVSDKAKTGVALSHVMGVAAAGAHEIAGPRQQDLLGLAPHVALYIDLTCKWLPRKFLSNQA